MYSITPGWMSGSAGVVNNAPRSRWRRQAERRPRSVSAEASGGRPSARRRFRRARSIRRRDETLQHRYVGFVECVSRREIFQEPGVVGERALGHRFIGLERNIDRDESTGCGGELGCRGHWQVSLLCGRAARLKLLRPEANLPNLRLDDVIANGA